MSDDRELTDHELTETTVKLKNYEWDTICEGLRVLMKLSCSTLYTQETKGNPFAILDYINDETGELSCGHTL